MSKTEYIKQIRESLISINQSLSTNLEQSLACSEEQKSAYYAQMGNLQKNLDTLELPNNTNLSD